MRKTAVLTGAAGFAGIHLLNHLLMHGYRVYAVVRKNSPHNIRLQEQNLLLNDQAYRNAFGWTGAGYTGELVVIEIDDSDFATLPEHINEPVDLFFHMASVPGSGRDDIAAAYRNVTDANAAVTAASALKCRRFIGTGSQAMYGVVDGTITEDIRYNSFNMYGAAKASICELTRGQCKCLGMEWCFGTIFSLIGEYEAQGRLIPDLIARLKNGDVSIKLSAGTQNWDYLDAGDCAEAFIRIAEKGVDGENYNVANGDYHPLKYFTEKLVNVYSQNGASVVYGEESFPRVNLEPDISKLRKDTAWRPGIQFLDTIKRVYG